MLVDDRLTQGTLHAPHKSVHIVIIYVVAKVFEKGEKPCLVPQILSLFHIVVFSVFI